MNINPLTTIRELAVSLPGATRVFEQTGIDYCCGGQRSLSDACQTSQLPFSEVVLLLEEAAQSVNPGDEIIDWQSRSLTTLCEHIVNTHHVFTRQELDRLTKLLEKVYSRHGSKHSELGELREIMPVLTGDLLPHMLKEEQVLFPYITQMEASIEGGRAIQPPFFVTVENPVRMMMSEHDTVADLLRAISQLTSNYVAPPDACISYQTLYQALREFEVDIHQHVHLENNLLFPRAVEMEAQTHPEWRAQASRHQCFTH